MGVQARVDRRGDLRVGVSERRRQIRDVRAARSGERAAARRGHGAKSSLSPAACRRAKSSSSRCQSVTTGTTDEDTIAERCGGGRYDLRANDERGEEQRRRRRAARVADREGSCGA